MQIPFDCLPAKLASNRTARAVQALACGLEDNKEFELMGQVLQQCKDHPQPASTVPSLHAADSWQICAAHQTRPHRPLPDAHPPAPDPLLTQILTQLTQVVPFTQAALLALTQDMLELRASYGLPPSRLAWMTTPMHQVPVVRELVANNQGRVLADVQADPSLMRASVQIIGQPHQQRSWLAVPLSLHEQVIGVLNLFHSTPGRYTLHDLELVHAAAIPLAVALAHVQQTQQAQVAAIDAERARIARDLHDAVTQTLFAASLIAEALPEVWQRSPEQGLRGLADLRQLTRSALAEMRSLLLELHPATLTEKPLGHMLRHLSEALMRRARVPVTVTVDDERRLPPDVQIALYRVTQEALNNIVKHAEASTVQLELRPWRTGISLCIQDDGRGFDPAGMPFNSLGLGIMRERAAQIGASLQINSQPGAGTRITVRWAEATPEG